MKRRKSLYKIVLSLLLIALSASFVYAEDPISIELYNKQTSDNSSFDSNNMFPGDSVTKYYNAKVSYKGKVGVNFDVDYEDKYNDLAKVTNIKIKLNNNVLYDGLVSELKDVSYTLQSDTKTTEELNYEITISLDTSVDSSFAYSELKFNFVWEVNEKDKENLVPNTSFDSSKLIYVGIIIVCIVLLLLMRKSDKNGR